MAECYSYRQFCSLGPLPPRSPARPDPQVPQNYDLGPCAHGKIGAFYFFTHGSKDDPAFGFFDIEVSVQSLAAGKVRLELYCIADGYQSSRGVSTRHPLRIAIQSGETTLATAEWFFADVICGHADPMHFSADLDIEPASFTSIDRVALLPVAGLSQPCG